MTMLNSLLLTTSTALAQVNASKGLTKNTTWSGLFNKEDSLLYFTFESDSINGNKVNDVSGNDHVGIAINTRQLEGIRGEGLDFNGIDSTIEIPHDDKLNLTNEITVSAWIKPFRIDGFGAIVQKWGDFSSRRQYLLDINNYGKAIFYISGSGVSFPYAEGGTTIPIGKWTHITGTYDGVTIRVYVNGVLDGVKKSSEGIFNSDISIRIGGYAPDSEFGENRHFSGAIDEVGIWRRAFSEDEIKKLLSSYSSIEQRTMRITSVETSLSSQAKAQISINNTDGIASGDITIRYDPNVLSISDVNSTNLTSNMNLTTNKSVPGQIKIVMAGANSLTSGSGSLADITMTANANAKVGSETILHFISAELYDESGKIIPINIEDGTIKIRQACIKGDANNDGNIKSNDATIILRIAAGLLEPNDYQKCAADVNSDGKIKSNDATIVLRKAAGLEAPVKDLIADRHINLSLSEAHGLMGETITIPITVDNIDILSSGDMSISYDSKVLRAIGVLSSDGLLMAGNINQPGLIRISFAGVERLNDGKLAEIRFEVLTDDVSPLTFKMAELYGTDALPLNSKFTNKQFRSWAVAPEQSALLQNYPNPFNPETWIPYQLHEANEIVIRIHNITGGLVRELRLGYKPAGLYTTQDRSAYWDGKNEAGERVSSGVYFYNIQAGKYSSTMKMIVTK